MPRTLAGAIAQIVQNQPTITAKGLNQLVIRQGQKQRRVTLPLSQAAETKTQNFG